MSRNLDPELFKDQEDLCSQYPAGATAGAAIARDVLAAADLQTLKETRRVIQDPVKARHGRTR